MFADPFTAPLHGLPDPGRDGQFYEGVPLRRLVAWCIDVLIVAAVGVPLALLFGLLTLGFGFAYRTLTLAGRSATWGMRFTGIELRQRDGSRFDGTTAILHIALYYLCLCVFPLQAVSCLTILTTRYRQSLGDMLLGTAAINRPVD